MSFLNQINQFAKQNKFKLQNIKINGLVGYEVQKDNLLQILQFIKEDPDIRFTILTDLFASDFPSRKKRFEVVYNLLSLKLNARIIIKVYLAEDENITSVDSIYKAACWYEREAFDMFGITFDNCPDMRRILTDYGFKGHPLRKDFPLTGHIQVKYDDKLEQVIYEPVLLEQEFRNFDFESPWQGDKGHKLPSDEKCTKHS